VRDWRDRAGEHVSSCDEAEHGAAHAAGRVFRRCVDGSWICKACAWDFDDDGKGSDADEQQDDEQRGDELQRIFGADSEDELDGGGGGALEREQRMQRQRLWHVNRMHNSALMRGCLQVLDEQREQCDALALAYMVHRRYKRGVRDDGGRSPQQWHTVEVLLHLKHTESEQAWANSQAQQLRNHVELLQSLLYRRVPAVHSESVRRLQRVLGGGGGGDAAQDDQRVERLLEQALPQYELRVERGNMDLVLKTMRFLSTRTAPAGRRA
jgi:hypothetical protein